MLRTSAGVAGAGAGVLCSVDASARLSDDAAQVGMGLVAVTLRAVSGHVLQEKPTRLGGECGRKSQG